MQSYFKKFLEFASNAFSLLIFPLLTLITLTVFNIVFLIVQIVNGTWVTIVTQAVLLLAIPVALIALFANRQYMKLCLLVYKECSTELTNRVVEYMKSQEFQNITDGNKPFVLPNSIQKIVTDNWFNGPLEFVPSTFTKERIFDIISIIPFSKIYDLTLFDNLNDPNDTNEPYSRKISNIPAWFMKRVDDFVEDRFDTGLLSIVITFVILINIITTIIL